MKSASIEALGSSFQAWAASPDAPEDAAAAAALFMQLKNLCMEIGRQGAEQCAVLNLLCYIDRPERIEMIHPFINDLCGKASSSMEKQWWYSEEIGEMLMTVIRWSFWARLEEIVFAGGAAGGRA